MPKKLTFNYEMLAPATITEQDAKDIQWLNELLLVKSHKITKQELIICARTSFVFVARKWQENGKGRIIGMANLVISHLPASRCEGFVEDVAVAPKHRRRGIASVLVQQISDYARERGAHMIYVASHIARQEGHAFYKKIGFKELEVKVFELPLK